MGLSDEVIELAWPDWWSDEAENSLSAFTELRFSIARKLGIDPVSMMEDDEPRFVWRDEAKFKRLSTETSSQRAALASFGTAISRALIAATPSYRALEGVDALSLRSTILQRQPYVRLIDLLALCWAMGIPVIHLRVFPLASKKMCAMATRFGERFGILLARDAHYPAPIAYYLAHELGHAVLGHLTEDAAIVDMTDPLRADFAGDKEEEAADRFALEILTGAAEPRVSTEVKRFTASRLAENLLETGPQLRIEPGTLALCYGHSTGDWTKATAAMRSIYQQAKPVWAEVNRVAAQQLDWSMISHDFGLFVRGVMGGIGDARSDA